MTDRKEAMDKLIAQDADLIDPVRDERQETIKLCLRNAIDWESIGNHKSAEFWRKVAGEIQTVDQQAAEIERLREALRLSNEAHWFYLGDDCSSDKCRFSIDECIDEDFEWDNPPMGDHVLQISGARPVPDMWVALHYFSEEEKDERDDDEPYSYTVHATEEEARAALGETE